MQHVVVLHSGKGVAHIYASFADTPLMTNSWINWIQLTKMKWIGTGIGIQLDSLRRNELTFEFTIQFMLLSVSI
jgi:hypothetical protein